MSSVQHHPGFSCFYVVFTNRWYCVWRPYSLRTRVTFKFQGKILNSDPNSPPPPGYTARPINTGREDITTNMIIINNNNPSQQPFTTTTTTTTTTKGKPQGYDAQLINAMLKSKGMSNSTSRLKRLQLSRANLMPGTESALAEHDDAKYSVAQTDGTPSGGNSIQNLVNFPQEEGLTQATVLLHFYFLQ